MFIVYHLYAYRIGLSNSGDSLSSRWIYRLKCLAAFGVDEFVVNKELFREFNRFNETLS